MSGATLAAAFALALLVRGSAANKFLCLDPDDYLGSSQPFVPNNADTCDTTMNSWTGSGGYLEGQDFSEPWNCDGKSSIVSFYVQYIGSMGCCGATGKNACWEDYSHVCHDPADYNRSHVHVDAPRTCDASMAYATRYPGQIFEGQNFSQAFSCDANLSAIIDGVNFMWSTGCCGNGKSACWKNYSYVCLDPADYDGSKEFTYEDDDGTTGTSTCDAAIAYNLAPDKPLKDEDFSQAWSCEGKSSAVTDVVQGITSVGCCGVNGKSACDGHYSYSGAGSFKRVGIFAIYMAVAIALA